MANQVLKSGTSIGANVREAQNAGSKDNFVHKMKAAAKEAEETEGWLLLCKYSASHPDMGTLPIQLGSIMRLLNKIIGTSKRRKNDKDK